jgi:hypothetical protein
MPRKPSPWPGFLALTIGAAGCAFTPPEQATIAAQPKTLPVRNVTSFSASLRCMDDLFQKFGKTNYLVTAQEIPDATGKVQTGTKEMLIAAISQMSVKSNAFNFIDFEEYGSVFVLGSFLAAPGGPPVPAGFEVPNYYVRGAITQLDSGVIAESASGGVGFENFDIGASTDQVMTVVSVDLNVGNVLNRRMLPGVSANNSIVVRRSGSAVDAGATISKMGANFNLTFNRSEGMHAAVRSLIELSTIEITGKLLQVPYWRCLEIEQTNPEVVAVARGWFDSMSTTDRVTFVQRALKAQNRYAGRSTARWTTRRATPSAPIRPNAACSPTAASISTSTPTSSPPTSHSAASRHPNAPPTPSSRWRRRSPSRSASISPRIAARRIATPPARPSASP